MSLTRAEARRKRARDIVELLERAAIARGEKPAIARGKMPCLLCGAGVERAGRGRPRLFCEAERCRRASRDGRKRMARAQAWAIAQRSGVRA